MILRNSSGALTQYPFAVSGQLVEREDAQLFRGPYSSSWLVAGSRRTLPGSIKLSIEIPEAYIADLPITRGLQLWLDASDVLTISASGGSVSQWRDKSGNGVHVSQASGSLQPTTGAQSINGLNTLSFSGVERLSNSSFALSQPFTVLAVIKHDSTTASHRWLDSTNIDVGTNAASAYRVRAGNDVQDGSVDTDPFVAAIVFDGASSELFDSGSSELTGDVGSNAFTDVVFGSSGFAFNGLIAEVLVFDGALSTLDRVAVEKYLGDKWGIDVGQAALPNPESIIDAVDDAVYLELPFYSGRVEGVTSSTVVPVARGYRLDLQVLLASTTSYPFGIITESGDSLTTESGDLLIVQ